MTDRRQPIDAHRQGGFSFGEMLIVVAVFALLATMFFISSQYAIVKSRVSRVLHDQREVVGRLELYVVENLELPSETVGLNALLHSPRGVSYMNSIPVDPFAVPAEGKPGKYLYFTNLAQQSQSVIVSIGPDGNSDLGPALDEMRKNQVVLSGAGGSHYLFVSPKQEKEFLVQYTYDPTNGSVSHGDIILPYAAPGVVSGN